MEPQCVITPVEMSRIMWELLDDMYQGGVVGRASNFRMADEKLISRGDLYQEIEDKLKDNGYHPWVRVALNPYVLTHHKSKIFADKAKDMYWQECCIDSQHFHWCCAKYVGDKRCDTSSSHYRPVLTCSPISRLMNSSMMNNVPWGPSTVFTTSHIRVKDIVKGVVDGICVTGNVLETEADGLFVVWNCVEDNSECCFKTGDICDVISVIRGNIEVVVGQRPRNICPQTEFYFLDIGSESRNYMTGSLTKEVVEAARPWHHQKSLANVIKSE